jgi:hypothetical protein
MKRNFQAGVRNIGARLQLFSEADLDDIHRATLEVLEHTGVFVESEPALDVLADGGCRVDRETKTVKIPPHIVEDVIRWSPKTVRLCGPKARLLQPASCVLTNAYPGVTTSWNRVGNGGGVPAMLSGGASGACRHGVTQGRPLSGTIM